MVRIWHTRIRARLSVCAVVALAVLAAGRLANAQASRDSTKADVRSLEKKVDDVLANQQLILKKLEDVMEELRIVKVRATHS